MRPTYDAALAALRDAYSTGRTALCPVCSGEATLLITCSGDRFFHGIACAGCWAAHLERIAAAAIFATSGMAETCCAVCGSVDVDAEHIQVKPIRVALANQN